VGEQQEVFGALKLVVIIYQSDKRRFLSDVFTRDIEQVILTQFKERTGRNVPPSEVRSWKESLVAVARVVNDDSIPGDCGVAIEYGIPQTSKRIDFMLSGTDADHVEQLVIIELKQWEKALKTDRDGIVRTRFAAGESDVNHPSYQAWSYASLLMNFNEAIYEGSVGLRPCAYLHNCEDAGALRDEFYLHYVKLAPIFLKGEEEKNSLRTFIKRHVRHGDRRSLLYRIENGRIRPSKGLIESLTGMLAGKQEFILIDDQKIAYEEALALASQAAAGEKQVVIIEGGPGTGKSVVAINLLVELTRRQQLARYVTKNSAPRTVFESVLAGTHRRSQISNLFSGSGSFTETETNVFDTLIVDEAHRLNEKSGLYGNLGVNQIEELIRAARCSVFFLDEDQRVTFKDIGERGAIFREAARVGAKVTTLGLKSQFRCNGSDGYLAWLDNTLGIRPSPANALLDAREFDFRVFDSPEAVRREIVRLNKARNRARMVAGYCWDWKSRKHPQAADVAIPEYDFAMQWNLDRERNFFMVAPNSVDQIGCIHTCQGLEVDYIGVVIGPDLVVRDGTVVTRPEMRSKHDKSLSGYGALMKTNPAEANRKADLIIKNTYRTLMTRGIKGCYVYFTDNQAENFVRERINFDRSAEFLAQVAEPQSSYTADSK
jgi:DUF2075 family protein